MAKKHTRFGKLHQALKDSGYTATTGRAGEYLNFLKGTNKLVVARKADSTYLKRFNVGVVPFGLEIKTAKDAVNSRQGSMTVLANVVLKSISTIAPDTLFGLERDLTKTEAHIGFYNATATISIVATSATKKSKTSGITKKDYKSYNARTGSVPYGRVLSPNIKDDSGAVVTDIFKVTEEDVRTSIMQSIKGKNTADYKVLGVTFHPEVYPETGLINTALDTKNAPTTLPAEKS